MRKLGVSLFLVLSILALGAFGQGVPAPLTIRSVPYITGLTLPVHITHANDGTNRLFIVQQRGLIRVVQPGSNVPTDFLNVSGVVSSSGNERGLLGLAFHPQYSTNRRFFIYYTRQSDGAIEIAEYATSTSNPNQANPTAVRTIITIPHPISNHNGGTILFGPDGYLYAGTGDGGGGNDTSNNAQNINSLLGKFLRIDIDTPVGQVPPYNIPSTNPYAGTIPGADEIYAIGMRNPYRFSFDRGGTNQLWVGDVGQDAVEEVDTITLGGNYGWRVYEGTRCTNNDPGLCTPTNYLPPVFEYSSASPSSRCSVTGGYVYRGGQNNFPAGSYVYSDFCTGEILLWNNNLQTLLLDTPRSVSSFGEDQNGELYIAGLGGGVGTGVVDKLVRSRASADFDGDLRTDIAVFRPTDGVWYINHSSNGTNRFQNFGLTGDIPTPEDYDGDNITDIGVFRPSNGTWYHFLSATNTVGIIQFGSSGDIPAAGDFDGDAKADFSVFRPSEGNWYRLNSSNAAFVLQNFGLTGDVPTAADYDGDGKYDISVFRPSNGTWYRINSSNPTFTGVVGFGQNGDVPVQGDFDGDLKADQAVFRNGTWYVLQSSNLAVQISNWGLAADIPVVGDYDGDNREDIAVFRPATGVWYIVRSSNGSHLFASWGLNGDLPAPRHDTP